MSTVNEDLIRNLYLKYAPNEDVDSKLEYIQNTYGDNQNLFVENFYNKYSPETDLSSKLEHINLKYPSTDVKKKEDTTEDLQIPAEPSIESGVEPDNLSLPLTNERFADAAGVVDLSKSLDDVKKPGIIEERLKAEEDKVSYFENLDVPQLDSAKTSYDQRLIDINRDLYYGRNQGKDFIDAAQSEKKSIEQDRDYATIVKGYKTKDYSMADEMFSAITKLDPNQADYPGVALMAREKYLEYEDGINSDYKEQIKDINWDDYTEVDFNGEERADVDKISKLSDNISSSIAEGEDVIRDIVYAKAFERAEQNSDIKSFEAKLREDQGLKDFYEETNTKAFDIFKSTNESSKEAESDLNQGVSKLNKMSAVKQDKAVETYKNSVNIYREQLKSQVAQGTLDADKASEMLNKFNVESFNTLDKIQNNLIKEFDFEVVSLSNIIENKYGDKMQSDYSDFLKSHNLSEEDKKELNSIYSRLQDDIKKEKFNRLKSKEMQWANLGLITSFGKSFNSTFARQLSGAGTFFNSKILTEIGDEMGTAFSVADEPLEEFSDYLNLSAVVKSIGRLGGSGAASIAVGAAIGSVSGGIGTIPSMALIATAGAMTETIDMAGNMEREVLAATGSKLKAERASEAVMQSQLGNLWTYSLDGLPFVGKALNFIPTKGLRIAAAGLGELPTEITQEVLQSAQEESIRESVDRGGKISAEGFSEKLSDPKFLKPIILEVAPGTVLFGGSTRGATEYMTSKRANKIVKEVVNNLNLSSVDKNNEFIKQKIHASILSQGKNFTNTWLSTLQKNGNITEKQLYDFYTFSNNIDGFVRETKGLDLDDNQSNIYFALSSKANELYDKADNVNDRVTKSELNERANTLKKNAQDFLRDPKAGGTYVVVKNFNNSPLILSEEQALSFVNQYGPILTNKNSGIEMTVVNSDKVSEALKKVEDIQGRYIPQENFDRALAILDPIASERRELTLDELTEVGEALGENGSNVLDIGDKVALLEQNAVDLYLDLSERKEEYLKEFETVEETTEDIAVEPEVVEETQEDVAVEPVEEESSGRSLLESRFGKTNMSEFDAAQKALSDISPETKIVVLNEKQYREQTKKSDSRESTSRGEFNYKTNTIYINADKADATTVAHEVFHAALLNALNMNMGSAMAVTKKLITSLSAKLDNLPTLKEYLNDFASNYEENIRDEEKLSELVGLLAKNYNSMNNESKSLIKRFIDKISEILGLTKDSRLRRELGQFAKIKDNKVVDLLNTIARKTTKGEVITTEDIEILEVQEQGESDLKSKQKATPQTRKQKVNEDVELLYPTTRQQRSFNFTQEQVDKALSSDKKSVEVLSKGLKPKEGDKVGVRLNLNVLKSKEIPIQTVHKGTNSKYKEVNGTSGFFRGEAIDYAPAVTLKNAYFNTDQRGIYKIKNGITNKTPVASVDGEYRKVLLDNTSFDGVEIKFNPMGSNLFVNAENNKPIRFVEEATVVGFRVYGRGKIEYFTEENKPKPYTPEEPQNRKQKDTSRKTKLKDVAEFSIQEGLSAQDTRAYLISIGYSKEEINSGMFDAQKIWNKDGKKIIKWLDWAKRWTLSKRSFKSISMFKAEETMEANIAAELKQAMNNAKELNKAFNAIKDTKERDKTVSDANDFLTDEQARETTLWRTMPKKIVELLFVMRRHIDSLSQKLIDSGAINAEESMQNIFNNIGVYMNRSYQVFDNKNWKEKVSEEVVTAAKNHLKQAYYNSFSGIEKLNKSYLEGKISEEEFNKQQNKLLSKQKPVNFIMKDQGVSEAEALSVYVDQVVDEILTGKDVMGYINSSQLGAKNTEILSRRKNIPEPIRALMGEYKDPSYNYAISIMKVANLAERQRFLSAIRDSGMGVYLFEKKPGRKMPDGYIPIALEGSEAMNPLNGLYGPKELVDEFQREAIKLGKFEKVYEFWLKSVGTVKYAKTILSVGTHAKNVLGNLFFMAQNGYVNPSDFNNAFNILKNDFMGKPNEKMEALMDEYIRAGLIGQGASIGEIKALFDTQDSFEKSLEKRMDSETQNRLDNIKKGTNKVFKAAQDLYQYEDDMFKIVAYEQEKRDYSKILFNKKYKDLTSQEQSSVNNYVAEIVKNILPNYSRIGKLGKAMKALPVAGTFISFQLEVYRTSGNTLSLIAKELKGDIPGVDAEAKSRLRRKGAKRLLALTSFYGFKYALLSTMGLALLPEGDDEDGKDKVSPLLPYWNKNADIIITDFKENGDFEYISLSSSDPYGSLFKTFNAARRYATEGGKVTDVLEQIYGPFIDEDILLKSLLGLKNNKNSYGGKVWEKDDPLGEKIIKGAAVLGSTFEPGTITSIRKVIKNDNSKVDEFLGQMTGFKPYTVNSTRQASYIFKDISDGVAESKKRYNRIKYNKDKMTQEEIDQDIKIAQDAVKAEYEKGIEIYNLLLSLGLSKTKINQIMTDSNINKDIQREIRMGKIKDIKYKKVRLR